MVIPHGTKGLLDETPPGTQATQANAYRLEAGTVGLISLAGVVLAVLGLTAWWTWSARHKPLASAPPLPVIRSVAVLPLENLTGDPAQEFLSDGMTDVLITDLAQIGSLRVISRTSSMAYKGTRKPLREIARELGVDGIVEGTVMRSAERVRVTAQVIRVEPEGHLWADVFDRPVHDVVELQEELARAISRAIHTTVTPGEHSRTATTHPTSRQGYEAFLRGRYLWNRRTEEATKKAIEYFQQAIADDPNYAIAYVGLADAYKSLALPDAMQEALPPHAAFPKAREAVTRALEVDDQLAEAHASLAHLKYLYDRDWYGAEREFRRAIELNPNYASAHQWYAYQLLWMGRLAEARDEIERAKDLDPLSLTIDGTLALVLSSRHQYDEAIELCRKPLEVAPDFAFAHYRLGQIYEFKGAYTEAIPELEKAMTLSGGSPRATAELSFAYARNGRRSEALRLREALRKQSSRRYVSPLNMAIVFAGLGDRASTLTWLEKAAEDRDPSLPVVTLNPAFADVKSDPRFTEVVRRVGLQR